MTPAEARESHRLFLAEGGEELRIRRYAGTPRVPTDTPPALGKAVSYAGKDIAGSAAIAERKFIVLVDDEIAALLPLTKADKLVRGSKEMPIGRVDDEARRFAGELIALEIWATI